MILAQTVKGYGLGKGIEARNITHQAKKLADEAPVYQRESKEAAYMEAVRAFRLDALSDKSLPKKGPGLSDNGNFVLGDAYLRQGRFDDAKHVLERGREIRPGQFPDSSTESAGEVQVQQADGSWKAIAKLSGRLNEAAGPVPRRPRRVRSGNVVLTTFMLPAVSIPSTSAIDRSAAATTKPTTRKSSRMRSSPRSTTRRSPRTTRLRSTRIPPHPASARR